jgi:hypothetical protein
VAFGDGWADDLVVLVSTSTDKEYQPRTLANMTCSFLVKDAEEDIKNSRLKA